MYNYGRRRAKKDKWVYMRKWSVRQVVAHSYKNEVNKEVERLSGGRPGSKAFMAHFQQGVKNVMEELSEEELAEAADQAEEWNVAAPPPEVQAR